MLKKLLKFLKRKAEYPKRFQADMGFSGQFKRMAQLGQNLIVMEGR